MYDVFDLFFSIWLLFVLLLINGVFFKRVINIGLFLVHMVQNLLFDVVAYLMNGSDPYWGCGDSYFCNYQGDVVKCSLVQTTDDLELIQSKLESTKSIGV